MSAREELAGTLRRPVVLCVDDEAPVLASLRRALRREPYEVLTTLHPAEALTWISRTAVDLVITDQRMPEMTGLELLSAAAQARPGMMYLMLTAFPDVAGLAERARGGEMRLMTKPWIEEELRETVRKLVEAVPGATRSADPWVWSCLDVREPLVVLDCSAAGGPELLDRLEDVRNHGGGSTAGWVLVLERLGAAEGGPVTLVERLLERLRAWKARTTLVDGSGALSGLLDQIEVPEFVSVHGAAGPERVGREILVAEGSRKTRGYLRTLVAALGDRCRSSPSAGAALLEAVRSAPDVALLDLGLPESGSIALARRLREMRPEMRIVGLSTFRDLWDEATCFRLGFSGHLEKPVRVSDLLREIGR